MRKLAEIASEKIGTAANERAPRGPSGPGAFATARVPTSGPIALRAFWSMHVEAMNWSGMGLAEYAAALGLSPHALRRWRDRLEESGY